MTNKTLKELTIEELYTYYKLINTLLEKAYNKRLSFEGLYDDFSNEKREDATKEIEKFKTKIEIILKEINRRIDEI